MQPPEPTGPPGPVRRRRGYWLPGSIAMTVLLVMALALGAGDLDHGAPKSLDGAEVATQVASWIQARQGYTDPPDVTCPAHEPIRVGLSFRCTARRGTSVSTVDAVEVSAQGQLKLSIVAGS